MASASASGAPAAEEEVLRRRRILSSRLYLDDDIPSSKAPVVYSPAYDISFDGLEKQHPFDSSKWGRVRGFLEDAGILQDDRIVEPLEASEDDLLVVHSKSYLNSLQSSEKVARIVEVPAVALLPNLLVQQKLLYPFRKQVGASVLSGKLALERGWAINIGGGFHHCSAEEGGGFCAYADISLCIHFAFIRLNISRVMIIDLDAHQGNGHEKDFGGDGRVYTLDMYNSGIYPFDHVAKKYIDQKVELDSGTKTEDYLENLDKALKVAESRFQPQLIVYNAGTDILDGDPLGRLKISPEGVAIRDEKVFRFAKDQNIPLLMLTSGGYMKSSARVIADSIINLSKKNLIDLVYCLDGSSESSSLKSFQETSPHGLRLRATRVWSLACSFCPLLSGTFLTQGRKLVLAGCNLWRANLQRLPDDLVESHFLSKVSIQDSRIMTGMLLGREQIGGIGLSRSLVFHVIERVSPLPAPHAETILSRKKCIFHPSTITKV